MSLATRIQKRMTDLGLTQAQLAERAGVSQVTIHLLVTGKSSTTKKASDLAKALNVDVGWLLTGVKSKSQHNNIEAGPEVLGFIPLVSWVAAGKWGEVVDLYAVGDAERWVPCPVPHGERTFVLKVRGESMEPEYRNGDWIFVDPSRQPENGSHVVVRMEDDQEATFKKLVIEGDRRYLVALNPAWPERVIEIDKTATIVGTVIFSGTPRV